MVNNLFLQGHENLKFLLRTGSSNIKFNHYMFRLVGITNKFIILCLDLLTPILYVLNIIFSFIFFTLKFIYSLINYRKEEERVPDDLDSIYLFFFNYFTDRCKSSKLYEDSKYYILMPSLDQKFVNISNKQILNYKLFLAKKNALSIYGKSLACLWSYVLHDRSLCFIHKAWEYYEVEIALRKISTNSTLIFCNQSDKWALLFDSIPSKSKVLLQHGVVSTWGRTPYCLKNIDVFYSMTRNTWQDAYDAILDCMPQLVFMEPTIQLFDTPSDRINVLIVSDIVQLETEKEILKFLSSYQELNIYLKKHPALHNDECYKELQHQYQFNYIVDKQFPKVDFVVSYYSTLAYEYMAHGIPAYIYMDRFDFNIDTLCHELNKILTNCLHNN